MAAAGGPATILAELPKGGTVHQVDVRRPVSRPVAVPWQAARSRAGLVRDVATEAQVTVALAIDEVNDVAVSPDGTEIAYVGGRQRRRRRVGAGELPPEGDGGGAAGKEVDIRLGSRLECRVVHDSGCTRDTGGAARVKIGSSACPPQRPVL